MLTGETGTVLDPGGLTLTSVGWQVAGKDARPGVGSPFDGLAGGISRPGGVSQRQ
jgi:hypothetical protein